MVVLVVLVVVVPRISCASGGGQEKIVTGREIPTFVLRRSMVSQHGADSRPRRHARATAQDRCVAGVRSASGRGRARRIVEVDEDGEATPDGTAEDTVPPGGLWA